MPDLAEMLARTDQLIAENSAMQEQVNSNLRSLREARKELIELRENIVTALDEESKRRTH
jgi:hypothetical protein